MIEKKSKEKISWNLKSVLIKELKDNPKNPREITKYKLNNLKNLIDEFGLIDKPIVNADFTLIGGHQRVRLLKKDKVKEVDCWVCDTLLNQEQIDKLCIGLNLHQGTWDWDVLANQWEPIDLFSYGFTEEQILGISEESQEKLCSNEKQKKKPKSCPNCGHQI